MIINIDDKKHLVLMPINISKEKFLLHAKVIKGSYFYKRLESIYIALTSSTTNVKDEYKTYYSEYDNFNEFLYHKYPYLTDDTRALIIEKVKTKKYILLRGYMYELADYNLQTLMVWNDEFSNDFKEKINKLLKAELYEN
jgi:hypothetical protein